MIANFHGPVAGRTNITSEPAEANRWRRFARVFLIVVSQDHYTTMTLNFGSFTSLVQAIQTMPFNIPFTWNHFSAVGYFWGERFSRWDSGQRAIRGTSGSAMRVVFCGAFSGSNKSNYLFPNMGFLQKKVWEIGKTVLYEL